MVEPAAMAASRSPDIPILKVSQSWGRACSDFTCSNKVFASANATLFSGAGITISPRKRMFGSWLICLTSSATSLGWQPSLLSCPSIFTWIQIFKGFRLSIRWLDNRSAIIRRSTPCTQSNFSAKCLVLLRCTWPIKCHSISKSCSSSIFVNASCK